jgi:site-specific recombinase XerD
MTKITAEELDNILIKTLSAFGSAYPFLHHTVNAAYFSGLRVSEIIDKAKYINVDENRIDIQLSKFDYKRRFDASEPAFPFLIECYNSRENHFRNYKVVNHFVGRSMPRLIFGNDVRRTKMHAYRYNYVKKEIANGKTIEQVQLIIGHRSLTSTEIYANDSIYIE